MKITKNQIIKLDESTINRIAAGEIINRPENVVKELMENCLDAHAHHISIIIKDGGLKQIIISDNGKGIHKHDFQLACERFCTSKLLEFNDLKSISTYGFRGEALASVSHVAHVTIVSRTSDSPCAFKGIYSDGALVSSSSTVQKKNDHHTIVEPKPIAGNVGTQITVDDLFYNLPIRKAAFKNHQEEYMRILQLVQKYAIVNAGVSFSCKKHASHQSDLQTLEKATQLDNIKLIYGESIANELLPFNHESKSNLYKFTVQGYLSNPNSSIKKKESIIFINGRLVECPSIRKSIDTIYSKFLPKSGSYSFTFLSLSLPPESIDVNVHPSKKHVHFYHEDMIVLELATLVDSVLTNADQTRVFLVPKSISMTSQIAKQSKGGGQTKPLASQPSLDISNPSRSSTQAKQKNPSLLVRTDSKTRTLDSFFTLPACSFSSSKSESESMSHSQSSFTPLTPVYKKMKKSEGGVARYRSEPVLVDHEMLDEVADDREEEDQEDNDSKGKDNEERFTEGNQLVDHSESDAFDDDEIDKDSEEENQDIGRNQSIGDYQIDFLDGIQNDQKRKGGGMKEDIENEIGMINPTTSNQKTQPLQLINIHSNDISDSVDGQKNDGVLEIDMDQIENGADKDTTKETPCLRPFVTVELDSVLQLRQELMERRCKVTSAILQDHTFVGCFDIHLALIQHNTCLLVVEVPVISRDFMYQIILYGFSNFGVIPVDPGLSLFELLCIGLDQCNEKFQPLMEEYGKDAVLKNAYESIINMRLMFEEYFSILIGQDGLLTGLPVLIPGYMPNPQYLAICMIELGLQVDYSQEKECFRQIAQVLADFYSFTGLRDDQSEQEYYHGVEHFLFAELCHAIGLPEWIEISKGKSESPCIREIANLQDLYKIFERC